MAMARIQWGKIHEIIVKESFLLPFHNSLGVQQSTVVLVVLNLCKEIGAAKKQVQVVNDSLMTKEHCSIVEYIGGAIIRKLKLCCSKIDSVAAQPLRASKR